VLLDHYTSKDLDDIFTKSLSKKRSEDFKQKSGVCHRNIKKKC